MIFFCKKLLTTVIYWCIIPGMKKQRYVVFNDETVWQVHFESVAKDFGGLVRAMNARKLFDNFRSYEWYNVYHLTGEFSDNGFEKMRLVGRVYFNGSKYSEFSGAL